MTEIELEIEQLILHQLLKALENDLRDILDDYVYEVLPSDLENTLVERRRNRPKRENQDSVRSLLNGLFLSEAVDAINSSSHLLPSDIHLEFSTLFNDPGRRSFIYELRKMDAHHDLGKTGINDLLTIFGELRSTCWTNLNNEIHSIQRGELANELRRAMPSRRFVIHNLDSREHEYTKLVGRSDELNRIMEDLRNRYHNFVSIVAEGGLGKSALALEIGHQFLVSGEFEFVFWYSAKTEFWSVAGSEKIENVETDLLAAVASLGTVIDPNFTGNVDEFFRILDDTKTLIILDNFETFTGASFESLVRSLPPQSNVKVLITSRWGVGNFENRIQLEPLSERESVHLLNRLAKEYGLKDILQLNVEAKSSLILEFGEGRPLDLVWFSRARSLGIPTSTLRTQKSEFLNFCVGNVIRQVDEKTQNLIYALAFGERQQLSLAETYLVLGYQEVTELTPLIQEAKRLGLISISSSESDASVEHLRVNDSARSFLEFEVPTNERAYWKELVQQQTRAVDNQMRQITSPFNIYTRTDDDKDAALILYRSLVLSRRNFDEAWRRIQSAINLRPSFFENYRVAGFVLSDRDPSESKKLFEKAMNLAGNGTEKAKVAYAFAEMLLGNSETGLALEFARQAHAQFGSPATKLQLGNVLVRLDSFPEAELLLQSALQESVWTQTKLLQTSLLRLYQRWSQSLCSKRPLNEEDILGSVTKGGNISVEILSQPDFDKSAANAILRYMSTLVQCWRMIESEGSAGSLKQMQELISELVEIVSESSDVLQTKANSNLVTYLVSQFRDTSWQLEFSDSVRASEEGELSGVIGIINFEKNFGFINGEFERFVFFSRSFRNKSDFALCKPGTQVYFRISTEKPTRENRIAVDIAIRDDRN
jgi:LuxR family glucitol operon transcriptional activator